MPCQSQKNHSIVNFQVDLPVHAVLSGNVYSTIVFDSRSDGYYLLYIQSGEVIIRTARETYHLSSLSIVFVPVNDGITIEPSQIPTELSLFFLSGPAADQAYVAYIQDSISGHIICQDSRLSDILSRIRNFYSYSGNYTEKTYLDFSNDLFLELSKTKLPDYHSKELPPQYASLMKQIFDTRYSESLTLDTLSKELHMNKFKLAKEYKIYYGVSPIEYLINRRIDVAKQLLTSTQKTVTQVGIEVAMENTPYFVSLFKRHVGQTPLMYRQQTQKNILPR